MRRILVPAIIAIGFHVALMAYMPSLFKKNEILPKKIKPVMVTLSHRQPIIEKTSLKPDKPVKETHSTNEIEKIIPNPQKTISITPKKKTTNILKKKDLTKSEKKVKQKEVIEKESNPVKVVEAKPIKAVKNQNFQVQPATLKKTIPQKKENITQQDAHIEFAKPLYKKNPLPVYPVIAKKRGYVGTVELIVLVSEKGEVNSLKIFKSSGYKSLDNQAFKTVKNWLFEPGKKNGVPEEMWVKIPVKFEFN
ncbi:MAG: TonB family protein [Proteobacteria bacterium]|nr:TonB family protein [Pseudomonadota bacterium]MBU1696998.1 TonB family protein [Pseudomonadota bacterium]